MPVSIFHHIPITEIYLYCTNQHRNELNVWLYRQETLLRSSFERGATLMVHEESPVTVLHNHFHLRSQSISQLEHWGWYVSPFDRIYSSNVTNHSVSAVFLQSTLQLSWVLKKVNFNSWYSVFTDNKSLHCVLSDTDILYHPILPSRRHLYSPMYSFTY